MREPKEWENYELVARHLLEEFADHFGLGRVEGKQLVSGESGANWEIDAKAFQTESETFLVVECRRYSTQRLKQEDVAALAYKIVDTRGAGGILVTPLPLQEGAAKVAEATNIAHVILRPDSTTTDYFMRHMNWVFVGVAEKYPIRVTDAVSIKITRADGTVETREFGDAI